MVDYVTRMMSGPTMDHRRAAAETSNDGREPVARESKKTDPAFMFVPEGPAHALDVGTSAVCGLDLIDAERTSLVSCLVFKIPLCPDCFAPPSIEDTD